MSLRAHSISHLRVNQAIRPVSPRGVEVGDFPDDGFDDDFLESLPPYIFFPGGEIKVRDCEFYSEDGMTTEEMIHKLEQIALYKGQTRAGFKVSSRSRNDLLLAKKADELAKRLQQLTGGEFRKNALTKIQRTKIKKAMTQAIYFLDVMDLLSELACRMKQLGEGNIGFIREPLNGNEKLLKTARDIMHQAVKNPDEKIVKEGLEFLKLLDIIEELKKISEDTSFSMKERNEALELLEDIRKNVDEEVRDKKEALEFSQKLERLLRKKRRTKGNHPVVIGFTTGPQTHHFARVAALKSL